MDDSASKLHLRSLAEMNLNSEEAAKANKEIMEMVDKDWPEILWPTVCIPDTLVSFDCD